MEHKFEFRGDKEELPMMFLISARDKTLTFATRQLVMPGDTVRGNGFVGTIKEIVEERPAKGTWLNDDPPTFYSVILH